MPQASTHQRRTSRRHLASLLALLLAVASTPAPSAADPPSATKPIPPGTRAPASSTTPTTSQPTVRVDPEEAAFIIISTDFETNTVTVDGQAYSRKFRRSKVGMPVTANELHVVRVENSGSNATKSYKVKLRKGEARVIMVELSGFQLKGGTSSPARPTVRTPPNKVQAKTAQKDDKESTGFLTVNSVPTAQVYIDGKLVSSQTPLVKHKVSPGNHTVRVYYNEKKKFSETKRALITEGRHVNLYFQSR